MKCACEERNETEKKYLEMEHRAEKAVAELEVKTRRTSTESAAEEEEEEFSKKDVQELNMTVEQMKEEDREEEKRRLEEKVECLMEDLNKRRDENRDLLERVKEYEE
ncbi:unnamed protein product, partial [Anisakis simplex]